MGILSCRDGLALDLFTCRVEKGEYHSTNSVAQVWIAPGLGAERAIRVLGQPISPVQE